MRRDKEKGGEKEKEIGKKRKRAGNLFCYFKHLQPCASGVRWNIKLSVAALILEKCSGVKVQALSGGRTQKGEVGKYKTV